MTKDDGELSDNCAVALAITAAVCFCGLLALHSAAFQGVARVVELEHLTKAIARTLTGNWLGGGGVVYVDVVVRPLLYTVLR